MSDLKNGSAFTLHIESSILLQGQSDFKFKANALTMPFSMQKTKITVDATPISPGSEVWVKAKTGSTIKSIGTVAEGTNVHISESLGDVGIGKIDSIEVTGTTPSGTETEVVAMELYGTKAGPDSSAITFSLSGVTQGTAKVIIYVDSNEMVTKSIYIGSTPTPTQTTGSSSGGDGSGVFVTSISPKSTDGLAILSSKWGSVRNANPDGLAIVTLSGITTPSNWRMIAGTYAVSPEATSFDPPATFSMTIPTTEAADMAKYQPFLAVFQEGNWNKVSATASGNILSVQIQASGKYAIFTENLVTPATTTTTAAKPTGVITSTAPTSSMAKTPAVVSSAQQTNAPVTTKASPAAPVTTTTQKAPGFTALSFVALCIGGAALTLTARKN
jgi:hypothetical protein